VLGNNDGESQVAVVETLIGQARTAAVFYTDPPARERSVTRLASSAWDHLRAAAPGSDQQLTWCRAFVGFARTPAHLSAARDLLDGVVVLEGLAMDTDLRWTIVGHLAAAGVADDGLIAAEAARDATDAGARHAAAARAAMPLPEAKARAWEQILDPAVPFATMRALMGGFQQPFQEELLEAYLQPYFDELRPVFERASMEVALGFTNGMYPRVLVEDRVVAMTEAYLSGQDPPAPVRRLLLEGMDGVQRALRARECDRQA
jgi:aminopeptidase N